ncbi:MAG: hypothetical protein IKO72_00905 [Kiritimatiellae bacterium]|nr:hypothetical protein [Kiritimatiellia bacterium]
MKMKRITLLPLVLLAGCFTLSQSEYPALGMSEVKVGTKIQLEGFLAEVLEYAPMYAAGALPPDRHIPPGMPPPDDVYVAYAYMPTLRSTDAFLRRATSNLEKAGCVLRASPAEYTVSGTFYGPYEGKWTALKRAGVFLGSICSARFAQQSYTAELKIYDASSGKMVFNRTYSQNYYASGWSPLPLLGIMDFDKVQDGYIKNWCLAALTDRITSDTADFLAQAKK